MPVDPDQAQRPQDQPQSLTVNETPLPVDPKTGRPLDIGVAGAKNPVIANIGVPNVAPTVQNPTQPGSPPPQATPPIPTKPAPESFKIEKAPPIIGQQAKTETAPEGQYDTTAVGGKDYRPQTPSPEDQQAKMQELAQTMKQDPSVGQQILNIAKATGKGLLEVIQAIGYGAAQSNKPLAYEVREKEKLAQMPIEAEKQRQIAEQQFEADLAKMKENYTQRRFEAGSKQELDLAQQKLQQEAQQAQLNRQNSLDIAKQQLIVPQAQFNLSRASQLRQILSEALAGGKVGE